MVWRLSGLPGLRGGQEVQLGRIEAVVRRQASQGFLNSLLYNILNENTTDKKNERDLRGQSPPDLIVIKISMYSM